METALALLAMVIVPTALPVAGAKNVTFSAAVWPGVRMVFAATPLTLNPEPVTPTLEIVRFALPALVKITPSELLEPAMTLPKSKVLTLETNSGVEAMPEPLAEITSGELGALLVMETEPVALPAALGEKTTLNVLYWPGAMFVGRAKPEVENPDPLTVTLEMVTVPVPVFCKVTVCDPVAPMAVPGKLALVGVAESCGWGVFVGGGVVGGGLPVLPEELTPLITPAQPWPINEAASTSATMHLDALFVSDL